MGDYINVQFVQFPAGIHGASTVNEDNGFTIFLDPRDSYEMQIETYYHEMGHILDGDFENISEKTASNAENNAHRKRFREPCETRNP